MEKEAKNMKPIIGITVGDINGIGTEVIIKALEHDDILHQMTPVIYGSAQLINHYRELLDIPDFNCEQVGSPEDIRHERVNVLNCWDEDVDINPGRVNEAGGKYAFISLERAARDAAAGYIEAMVTAPINKHNIQQAGFAFPGHTEYLTDAVDQTDSLMFMVAEQLRVAVATGHIPLRDVPNSITQETMQLKLDLMLESLQEDFGIAKPKAAVLGLNPHAGEGGLLGSEENEIIKPLVEENKSRGRLVMGPFSADGFFGSSDYKKFDAALAMYHDQGLIPFKAMAFHDGVNFTAGLPIVRTSPDHGTAYNIAGNNQADANSMRQALYLAADVANQRRETQY